MLKIKSCSLSETENIAQNIAKNLSGNEIIAFFGDLGVGKTAFIHGIAKYFNIEKDKNLLVTGVTGIGKTNLFNNIILNKKKSQPTFAGPAFLQFI